MDPGKRPVPEHFWNDGNSFFEIGLKFYPEVGQLLANSIST
jgi:hypothetical protein